MRGAIAHPYGALEFRQQIQVTCVGQGTHVRRTDTASLRRGLYAKVIAAAIQKLAEIRNGLAHNPDSCCSVRRSSWRVGIAVEAEHAVLIRRDGFEVEAGFAQQCDVAAEGS